MTENEIITAWECCSNVITSSCKECPLHLTYNANCVRELMRVSLDLFNRTKAENERLQNESIGNCEMAIAMRSDHNLDVDCNYCIDKAKSEAYREFAEKIKEGEVYMRVDFPNTECGTETYIVLSDDIDTTLKELTENNDLEE